MNTIRQSLAAAAPVAMAATASASTTVYSGNLGDTANGALVSGANGAAYGSAPDPADVANNVALYTFDVTLAGTVSIASTSFAGGGIDPYFTLFTGSGPAATFLDSNYNQAVLGAGGDFSWSGTLAAGTYEIALGTTENISFAEQYPTLYTLGDGFIGFGIDGAQGNGDYALTLTTPTPPVPEPAPAALLGLGLAGLALRKSHARRSA
jgi:hypothetical protein